MQRKPLVHKSGLCHSPGLFCDFQPEAIKRLSFVGKQLLRHIFGSRPDDQTTILRTNLRAKRSECFALCRILNLFGNMDAAVVWKQHKPPAGQIHLIRDPQTFGIRTLFGLALHDDHVAAAKARILSKRQKCMEICSDIDKCRMQRRLDALNPAEIYAFRLIIRSQLLGMNLAEHSIIQNSGADVSEGIIDNQFSGHIHISISGMA